MMEQICKITGMSMAQQKKWPLFHSLLTDKLVINRAEISTDKLSKEIMQFCSRQETTDEIQERKDAIISHLKKRFNRKFNGSKLTAFGSSESGLGLKNGDIDLCLEFKGEKPKKVLTKIARMLREDGMEDVTLIAHAKVPIVKFTDSRTKIPIDISINNSLAIYNTSLLKLYNDCDVRVRPFVLAIKNWALHRGICNAAYGTFSSYAWTLIALQFLQTSNPPVLPNIQQGDKRILREVEGTIYDLTMNENPADLIKSDNSDNIGDLIIDFFDQFSNNWPWDENVISIRSGKMISRKEKNWEEDKPKLIDALVDENKLRLGKHSLPVEDPFDHLHDLSRVLRTEGVMDIREEFLRAYRVLNEGGSWSEVVKTKFPELVNDSPKTDLFEDLREIPKQEVIDKLEILQDQLNEVESKIKVRKSERNNAIEMSKAIRKNAELKNEENKLGNSLKPRRDKIEKVKKERDSVNNNYIPVHWIEDEMMKVFYRLTEDVDQMSAPSLKKEKELFSWFFELQSMHQHSKKTRELHNQFIKLLDEQKDTLDELDLVKKSSNELFGNYENFDDLAHKLLLELNSIHNEKRTLRREIGRLEAWLRICDRKKRDRKKSNYRKQNNRNISKTRSSVNIEEVKSRASSGESISLSDLGALLNSGGFSSIQNVGKEKSERKKKKKMNNNFTASRGKRGRSKKNY
ncbi:MAG: hypothetical protein CMA81_05930 [Euryarchaeota archaeon]|nr:hypothetical protein [Euryarchaeota archaeon]